MYYDKGHQACGFYVPSIKDTSDKPQLRTHLHSGNVAPQPLTAHWLHCVGVLLPPLLWGGRKGEDMRWLIWAALRWKQVCST